MLGFMRGLAVKSYMLSFMRGHFTQMWKTLARPHPTTKRGGFGPQKLV